MFEVELDVSELEAVITKLPQVEGMADRRMRAAMEEMLAYLLQKAVEITHRRALVNTGAYVNSLGTQIHGMATSLRGTLAPRVAHGVFVERGRGAGRQPPSGPIELWVRRRLGISDDDEVRAVGYLVARAIGRRGTIARFGYKGGEVLETTKKEGEGKVLGTWEKMVGELVAEIERLLG